MCEKLTLDHLHKEIYDEYQFSRGIASPARLAGKAGLRTGPQWQKNMKFYNSLTQKKELFIPRNKKEITMYVCGITPYDTTHLGHAFTYIFFDVLSRYLKFLGYNVNYTQNVTDIDDDILRKAKEEKRDWQELGTFWTNKFLTDLKNLHIIPPTHYVKATSAIGEIIQIITSLIEKNIAYEKGGYVYFDVTKFPAYGNLSHYSEPQMLLLSKERGANPDDPLKKHPLDFILWQNSKKDEPFWESPWGRGRPGWHIECSAMIYKYLGEQIDIHGGGRDLMYPHHESERAQSESYTGKKPFVTHWLHTAMVMYQGEKMSKSLGNLIMVSDLLKKYSPNAVRYILLSHHYRMTWEFQEEELEKAEKELEIMRNALQKKIKPSKNTENHETLQEVTKYLDDDMNTPQVLKEMEKLAQEILSEKYNENIYSKQESLRKTTMIIGFRN